MYRPKRKWQLEGVGVEEAQEPTKISKVVVVASEMSWNFVSEVSGNRGMTCDCEVLAHIIVASFELLRIIISISIYYYY